MKRLVMIGLVLSVACVVALPARAQDGDTRAAIAADYPRVDGSTSARPLQKIIACQIFDISWVWFPNTFETAHYVMAGLHREQIGDPVRTHGVEIINMTLQHNGTHGAYTNLIAGEADFILVARAPSDDELAMAEAAGVTLDAVLVAWDAFVFLANTANPLESLTLDEIRGVYTGAIISWTELGVTEPIIPVEPDNPIAPYTRNPNSGSQELMEALVMQGEPMIDAPDMMQMTMAGPLSVIDSDHLGLGYSVYFYVNYIQPMPNIKLLGVEGVVPTSETIADGSYPLATEVYAVVRADTPAASTAVLLRDWLLTAEGQAAVAASGYVPLMGAE